jgi:hypothetical protein
MTLRLLCGAVLRLPYQRTCLALCVRPSVRASASAALTQALPQDMQRLGPERISSTARARPTRVAPALRPGTAPEQSSPRNAPNCAPRSAPIFAQRPGHATSAISAAPSRRGRAGQRLRHGQRVLWHGWPCPPLTKGSEGSHEQGEWPRMHERVAHGWGAAKLITANVANAWGAAEREKERVEDARGTAQTRKGLS